MLYQIKCDYAGNGANTSFIVKSNTHPVMQELENFMGDMFGNDVVHFDLNTLSCVEVAVINFN